LSFFPAFFLHQLVSRRRCQSKEYQRGLIEAQGILVVEAPDWRADPGFRNGGRLVHHKAASDASSIALVRFDSKPECGASVSSVVNARIVMDSVPSNLSSPGDDDGPRLARIIVAARNDPDVAASHACRSASTINVDTASMNA
jgi:hypothetical protein